MKTVRKHSNDKLRLNYKIKKLIDIRQRAFAAGNTSQWKQLRNRVQREIKKAKTDYYANRVRHLQKIDSRQWHRQIKFMTSNTKSEVNIPVPGVKGTYHSSIANNINNCFVSVSAHLEKLDISKLNAFLPTFEPLPCLQPWDVYAELKKVKQAKACGPDGIPPKLVK